MSALSLADLRVTFPDGTEAVRGVSLEVARGEVLSLIGESGSGKSATLAAIAGLLPRGTRVSGTLRLKGVQGDLLAPGADRRGVAGRRMGMVFQNPGGSLNPVLSVGDQVAEVAATHQRLGRRAAADAATALLARVGLPDPAAKARAYPHQLSGGQRQRVAIAAALAGDPAVLLADEPTTALDATVQARILDLLLDLVDERGLAMVFVTHDLAVAAAIGDRALVMRHGAVVEAGPAREVLARPSDPYTAALADAARPAAPPPPRAPAAPGGLVLTGLTRRFGGRAPMLALDGVSLTLGRGEVVGLIGESGSGKTTLGRIAVGLDAPDAGTVTLDGAPLRPGRDRAQRAAVQMVFQDPLASFNPRARIGAAIRIPLRIHHGLRAAAARARAAELLGDVGLDPALASRRPAELSGGQLQRAAIARALAPGPAYLICDEAVASLDAAIRGQILDLLERLRDERGLGILFISHDLGVVRRIADRTVVLRAGRVVESGPTAEILRAPRQDYTKALLAAVPDGGTPWRARPRAA